MTTDQRTANLGLPLPHPNNDLAQDVLRLRDALTGLDYAVGHDTGVVIMRNEAGAIVQITQQRASGDAVTTISRTAGAIASTTTTTAAGSVTVALTRNEAGLLTHISRTEDPAT